MSAKKMVSRGQVHVYTGDGKGKTTAAFGLALRACMSGKKVFIGQFIKSMRYNETRIADLFENISVELFGCGCMLMRAPDEADKQRAQEGLRKCAECLKSGDWDMVVFDEITIALNMELIGIDELIKALDNRATKTEVVLTGRYAPQRLIDYADLVTDMQEVKHYYCQQRTFVARRHRPISTQKKANNRLFPYRKLSPEYDNESFVLSK
ncbi:cob(I)yrinic acid a,c-diamide adenosyltransferase [Prevotella intermedia]|uniref:corrinoid adenosyltransferase n=1 Tax=Prevotella intermedia TaxID=28131 RepID=A0A0T7APW9_PREIN|nr:cob(I)yrinic acid a,c-diamide adenosyltransferase [Prevotella intermedia]BAU19167.1 putative cob(I)yrinic acid a,c-diamide adenosyltransferase [Prevotella intermedia]